MNLGVLQNAKNSLTSFPRRNLLYGVNKYYEIEIPKVTKPIALHGGDVGSDTVYGLIPLKMGAENTRHDFFFNGPAAQHWPGPPHSRGF